MTYEEFWKLVNPKPKSHDSSAYQTTLKSMNEYGSIDEYPRVMRRIILRGIQFEFRLKVDHQRWNDHQTGEPRERTDYYIGVFNEERQKVASAQDEWNCMLVMVAAEYRGFGIGPLLTKMAYEIEPGKNTGGMTYSGGKVLVKMHRECVRQALVTGRYNALIKSGAMTPARVKEIIQSAHLEIKQKTPKDNLSSNDPKDWLLYVGGYGDFILYDRKLKDVIELDKVPKDPWERHSDTLMWQEKMIKGVVYAHALNSQTDNALIYQFYGVSPKIKQFMMGCAITFCEKEKLTLYVDPDDEAFVGKMGSLGASSMTTGYRRCPVLDVANTLPVDHMGIAEQLFRRQFDKYDEFKNQLLELGFSRGN